MTFKQAVVEAVRVSKREFEIAYVYEEDSNFEVETKYRKGWVFQAYPGGRTVASLRGAELIEQSTTA